MDDKEREKLEADIDIIIYEAVGVGLSMYGAMEIRKRILELPEIAEALEAYEPEEPAPYLSPKERIALQRQANEVRRAMLDKLAKPNA